MKVRVATCVPRQYWKQTEKLTWLDKALGEYPSDLFITSQELFGGGSTREICKINGTKTDDFPVAEQWLNDKIGDLARKHKTCIGVGASVRRGDWTTEDFLYYSRKGDLLGYHSKIALPEFDNITLEGASGIRPETNYDRACRVIKIPELGILVGTVFCWQVFFVDFWNDLMHQGCTLVAHPIKFAPRAWYKGGENDAEENVRVGFNQDSISKHPWSDRLGWIKKLRYESEFKQLPIAVSCNTWDAGEKYLALCGWVDRVTGNTKLFNVPSTPGAEQVYVAEYDPALFDAVHTLNFNKHDHYRDFKDDFARVARKTMMRKSIKLEKHTRTGETAKRVMRYSLKNG